MSDLNGERYTAIAEINLAAAFSTVPGGETDAIRSFLTESIQQIAQDDGSWAVGAENARGSKFSSRGRMWSRVWKAVRRAEAPGGLGSSRI